MTNPSSSNPYCAASPHAHWSQRSIRRRRPPMRYGNPNLHGQGRRRCTSARSYIVTCNASRTASNHGPRGTFERDLTLLGVEPQDLAVARDRVLAALTRALDDPSGRWVLGAHAEARSELRLTVRNGRLLEHLRLDRTFVDDGKRWIVDFKTSQHQGGDLDAFLDSEVERYRAQLERYAHALAAVDSRPIYLGLYFPLLAKFRGWPATTNP